MLNLLRVDIKRYLMTKPFLILAVIAAVLQPLFTQLLLQGMSGVLGTEAYVSMNDFAVYTDLAAIYLAVFTTVFLYAEAGEGIIRNKLISGKHRSQVLLSYCVVNAALAAFLQIVSVLVTALTALCMGAKMLVTLQEVIRFTLIAVLASIAVSTLYTVLYLCNCTQKWAIAIPGAIAIFMRTTMFFVLDALYTSSGVPKVSGATLTVYQWIDRYVAFYHLNGLVRYDNASYLIGNIVLIAVTLSVGSLVFSKKDLN